MVVHYVRPGRSQLLTGVHLKTHADPAPVSTVPEGLYPLRFSAHQMDEYRLLAGWPVSVPDFDIRARTLISANGEVIADRPTPYSLTTNALVRWVADDEMYDTTTLAWQPHQNEFPLVWQSATNYSPTYLPEYEYGIRDERFYRRGLNFDSDSREHMWCDMGSVLGGTSGYTVIMVASMNSVYGNNLDLPYNGIWGPGRATPLADTFAEPINNGWVSVDLQGQHIYVGSDEYPRKRALSVSHLLADEAPLYLAMVISKPYTFIHAGAGPSSMRLGLVMTGKRATTLTGETVLGRTNGDVLHTADMTLMDIGVYGETLSGREVVDEISKLSSVYGGDT